MTNDNIAKVLFYCSLYSLLSETRAAYKLIPLGDFNTTVEKEHKAWPFTLRKLGRGEIFLTKYSKYELAIINTFFNNSDK